VGRGSGEPPLARANTTMSPRRTFARERLRRCVMRRLIEAKLPAPNRMASHNLHGTLCGGHIENHPIKGFQVRVVDAKGLLVRMFTHPTIKSARRAAKAWTVAYGNCPIDDKSGVRE
jgi:hypothetical protein